MKLLPVTIAIVALMMTMQTRASIVSDSPEISEPAPDHDAEPFIRNLFGSLDFSEEDLDSHPVRRSRSSRNPERFTRFGSRQDVSGFFRSTGTDEMHRVLHATGLIDSDDDSDDSVDSDVGTGDTFVIAGVPSAVPVPAAIWLFGSGLAGLFAFSSRRKA